MQQIASLFTVPTQAKSKETERGSLLQFFQESINKERVGTKYKPLSIRAIAIKTSHLSLHDLYFMQSQAKDNKRRGGSISKYFFGSLRVGDNHIVQKEH